MDIQPPKKYKILLIGDDGVDVYRFGHVNRISPEAPVPVFEPVREQQRPGMAANVAKNLRNLGCDVDYLHGKTSIKTRLIDIRSGQQLLRMDEDVISVATEIESQGPLLYDAVVISDYNKGTVSYELIRQLRKSFTGPIFVDTKKTDLERFEGCIVKINSAEHSRISSRCDDLIVTLGRDGAIYRGQIYPAPKIEVVDVTGAGDTFLAALCWQYMLTGGSVNQAIEFAIRASSITVQQLGAYAPMREEIK